MVHHLWKSFCLSSVIVVWGDLDALGVVVVTSMVSTCRVVRLLTMAGVDRHVSPDQWQCDVVAVVVTGNSLYLSYICMFIIAVVVAVIIIMSDCHLMWSNWSCSFLIVKFC